MALPYAGRPVLARFAEWANGPVDELLGTWRGPAVDAWSTSMDETAYRIGVERVREAIASGTVYQANLCRVMSAPVDPEAHDVAALHALLAAGNPAPYGGFLRLPDHGIGIASASPELFLSVKSETSGRVAVSGPIKGTGRTESDLSDKDRAENVMIVDLVRNDLGRVCRPGSVSVPALLKIEEHPGLVHLVSKVAGTLRGDVTWAGLIDATFPPGSVTGAPKSSALRLIEEWECAPREFYCGALGWIDADSGEAELAVAIRTFWLREDQVCFGTGAGITWASDPLAEWDETELKARNLIEVASRSWPVEGEQA